MKRLITVLIIAAFVLTATAEAGQFARKQWTKKKIRVIAQQIFNRNETRIKAYFREQATLAAEVAWQDEISTLFDDVAALQEAQISLNESSRRFQAQFTTIQCPPGEFLTAIQTQNPRSEIVGVCQPEANTSAAPGARTRESHVLVIQNSINELVQCSRGRLVDAGYQRPTGVDVRMWEPDVSDLSLPIEYPDSVRVVADNNTSGATASITVTLYCEV